MKDMKKITAKFESACEEWSLKQQHDLKCFIFAEACTEGDVCDRELDYFIIPFTDQFAAKISTMLRVSHEYSLNVSFHDQQLVNGATGSLSEGVKISVDTYGEIFLHQSFRQKHMSALVYEGCFPVEFLSAFLDYSKNFLDSLSETGDLQQSDSYSFRLVSLIHELDLLLIFNNNHVASKLGCNVNDAPSSIDEALSEIIPDCLFSTDVDEVEEMVSEHFGNDCFKCLSLADVFEHIESWSTTPA